MWLRIARQLGSNVGYTELNTGGLVVARANGIAALSCVTYVFRVGTFRVGDVSLCDRIRTLFSGSM